MKKVLAETFVSLDFEYGHVVVQGGAVAVLCEKARKDARRLIFDSRAVNDVELILELA